MDAEIVFVFDEIKEVDPNSALIDRHKAWKRDIMSLWQILAAQPNSYSSKSISYKYSACRTKGTRKWKRENVMCYLEDFLKLKNSMHITASLYLKFLLHDYIKTF